MNISRHLFCIMFFACFLSSAVFAGQDVVGCRENCSKTITWTGCEISKLGFMMELADVYGREKGLKFVLSGGGATKGIRDVVKGDAHLGGTCRLPMSPQNVATHDEKEAAALESRSLLIPMGWDALVVIVHKDNPVSNISVKELKKILKGEITDWGSLGANNGKKGKFNLYVRTGKISGVGRTLRQNLFNNAHEDFTATAKNIGASGGIEKGVEQDVDGIAVTGYSSARKRAGLKILDLNGHANTMENLASGKYPIYRLLILTVRKDSLQDTDIMDFILYAKSREAGDVIKNAGTLPFAEGLRLASKLNENYLMELFNLEEKGRYNPSDFNIKRWAASQ